MLGVVDLFVGKVLLVALLRREQINNLVGCEGCLGELGGVVGNYATSSSVREFYYCR